jgi:uncharacterized membrane protein YoaK (UPF0700 family)
MDASTAGEPPDFQQDRTQRSGRDAARSEETVTLAMFVAACRRGALHTHLLLLLLILTLAAGWTDAVCYFSVGGVWASIMSGNILFVGLSIVTRNTALLTRAGVALLLFLVGVIVGSRSLQMLPMHQSMGHWRRTFACYLLVEGVVLLAFAIVWSLVGNLAQHPAVQVVLLGIAAFGMGLQGALVGAFNILDINTAALTGTELLLGIRLAQWILGRPANQPAETKGPFLVALILIYMAGAFAVALTVPRIGVAAFMPCVLVVGAVLVLAMPERRNLFGSVATGI